MLELRVCMVVRFAGFASCCCQGAKTPPKRVERSTVKLLALFKDGHGAMGVPAGCEIYLCCSSYISNDHISQPSLAATMPVIEYILSLKIYLFGG